MTPKSTVIRNTSRIARASLPAGGDVRLGPSSGSCPTCGEIALQIP